MMRSLWVGAILLASSFRVATSETSLTTLSLQISAEKLELTAGEFPKITAVITNWGSEPVVLVLPGDGSRDGDRTPIISWNIRIIRQSRKPDGELVGGGCGNMNPLRPDEVFTLKPGEGRSLGGWVSLTPFRIPGTYAVQFTYRNDPSLEWKADPNPGQRHDPEAMERVRSSTACDLASNYLTFTVR